MTISDWYMFSLKGMVRQRFTQGWVASFCGEERIAAKGWFPNGSAIPFGCTEKAATPTQSLLTEVTCNIWDDNKIFRNSQKNLLTQRSLFPKLMIMIIVIIAERLFSWTLKRNSDSFYGPGGCGKVSREISWRMCFCVLKSM